MLSFFNFIRLELSKDNKYFRPLEEPARLFESLFAFGCKYWVAVEAFQEVGDQDGKNSRTYSDDSRRTCFCDEAREVEQGVKRSRNQDDESADVAHSDLRVLKRVTE